MGPSHLACLVGVPFRIARLTKFSRMMESFTAMPERAIKTMTG